MVREDITKLVEQFAENEFHGWLSDEEVQCIANECSRLQANQTYVEVGVAFGKSLCVASKYAHEEANIYGVDICNWEDRRNELMKKMGIPNRAHFIEGDAVEAAKEWKRKKRPGIDLLFIDGDHSYYGVMRDLLAYIPLVNHGGVIMMHDYDITSPGVMRAIHECIFPHDAYDNYSQEGSIYKFRKI